MTDHDPASKSSFPVLFRGVYSIRMHFMRVDEPHFTNTRIPQVHVPRVPRVPHECTPCITHALEVNLRALQVAVSVHRKRSFGDALRVDMVRSDCIDVVLLTLGLTPRRGRLHCRKHIGHGKISSSRNRRCMRRLFRIRLS